MGSFRHWTGGGRRIGRFPVNNDLGGKNVSRAAESKITTPDEDRKKLEKLYSIVDGRIEEHIREINSKLLGHDQKLDAIIQDLTNIVTTLNGQQPQGQAPQPQQGQSINYNQLPLDVKAEALGKIGEGVAKIVEAWKGGKTQQSPMGALGESMIQDLVRTTIDDIQQRVYGIRKIPPASVVAQTASTEHKLQWENGYTKNYI